MKQTVAARLARWCDLHRALTGHEWASIGGMTLLVAVLHFLGWGVLAGVAAGQLRGAPASAFGVGLGMAAYALGLRHAFDADHLAAIDNITRKLCNDGRRRMSVGFWFSLGHSSIVFGMCALLAAGIQNIAGANAGGAQLHSFMSVFGTALSGIFLYIIGVLNLGVLLGIIRSVRRMRSGQYDAVELDQAMTLNGGLLNRMYGRLACAISRPWQVYGVGLLFGLGFDTATEVSLLILAGGAAASTLPWYAIMTLPVLFAAGMSLLDSIDGVFMNFAYGWALSRPVRRTYYNLVITGLSVAVALGIGSVELLSILVRRTGINTGPLAAIGGLDLNAIGYLIVLLFIVTWVLALGIWRWAHIEERWSGTEHL